MNFDLNSLFEFINDERELESTQRRKKKQDINKHEFEREKFERKNFRKWQRFSITNETWNAINTRNKKKNFDYDQIENSQ
jgi:hypothetical protein